MTTPNPPEVPFDLWSDELVGKKRNILMDMLSGILNSPRKQSSAALWKLYIDGALDRLDAEVYQPALQALVTAQKPERKGKPGIGLYSWQVKENQILDEYEAKILKALKGGSEL